MKRIRTSADLAINGAPPAFENQLHVGRPNIGARDSFMRRVHQVLDSRWLTNNGPMAQELEQRIGGLLGVKHCVAMSNGTVALEIAIRALGLKGEVIVPSWTFIATAHALHWQNITPVFADIDPETHNLDPAAVRRMITSRTTGIIGVHLWGRAAPVEELQSIASEHNLKLMFDAAHAFGCTHNSRPIGRFGACEVLSFHATKAFNSMEGGAIVTNDDDLAETARLMRNFGFAGFDNVVHPGTNGKMTEVCAAMGLSNLDVLDEVFATNRRNHSSYKNAFSGMKSLSLIDYPEKETNSHHYIVMEVDEGFSTSRDRIISSLHAENVLARKYFWPGCHKMKPYRELFPHSDLMLKSTEKLSERVIVLPNGNDLNETGIEIIRDIFSVLA